MKKELVAMVLGDIEDILLKATDILEDSEEVLEDTAKTKDEEYILRRVSILRKDIYQIINDIPEIIDIADMSLED